MSPAQLELAEVEILQAFKSRMPRPDSATNASPFDGKVATNTGADDGGTDLAELNGAVRDRIRATIEAVRDGIRDSQVILLSGDAGSGKTHLLNTFRPPSRQAELGYLFVGGSNHWKVAEFEARLLEWTVATITTPSPTDGHPLLDRIRAIGFRAVETLLATPHVGPYLARRGRTWFGRRLGWLGRPSHETVRQLCAARDPSLFAHFDEHQFGNYVCDRFLADRTNQLHRYALRVLLTYLFPDAVELGVGSRERVLYWFRGRADNEYFTRRLGANECLDRGFSQFDAVKLLAHLFSPAVSRQLSTEAHPCQPRVLLLAFDQSEGRNELFDGDADWMDFFAQLSELYNTLPNVVVLFTMTLALRNRLHAMMERQFRDRIAMGEAFTLRLPATAEMKRLYRRRVEQWVSVDPVLLERYRSRPDCYLPFSEAELDGVIGDRLPVRVAFEKLDDAFRREVGKVVVEPHLDFLYIANEYRAEKGVERAFDYTEGHLATLSRLLQSLGESLAAGYGLRLAGHEAVSGDAPSALQITFQKADSPLVVVISVAYLGWQYTSQIGQLAQQHLHGQFKNRTFLWVVRPEKMQYDPPKLYAEQFFSRLCGAPVEVAFRALLHVAEKASAYTSPEQQVAFRELVRAEVAKTYLGDLFQHARERLEALAALATKSAP